MAAGLTKAFLRGDDREPVRRSGRPSLVEVGQLNEHLLDIAERLFLAQGFEGTSMDMLAVEARASKRTIYHRYPGKDALFEAVIERAIGRLLKGVGETSSAGSLEARLEQLALDLIDRALRPQLLALTRTVIAEATRFPDLAQSYDRRVRLRTTAFVVEVLTREVDAEALPLKPPIEVWADQFLSFTTLDYLLRGMLGVSVERLRAEARERIGGSVAAFLNGCRGR